LESKYPGIPKTLLDIAEEMFMKEFYELIQKRKEEIEKENEIEAENLANDWKQFLEQK
jgi:hypothetical protein